MAESKVWLGDRGRDEMVAILKGILFECWEILVESAPYILFGFLAAGVLKALISEEKVVRHLGNRSLGSVLKASLFGIPLPLCSCGVIPAAVELRKKGASKGASAAFLVSVPETGVDSIAITWALLDPIMTVIRPVAAFITATLTGMAVNRLPEEAPNPAAPKGEEGSSCSPECGGENGSAANSVSRRIREGINYAFGQLLKDIGGWLLLGIAIAGAIAYFVPGDFFLRTMRNEWLSLLIMLGVGIPLYICASASTPIAAVLILKGLSPGAALVFLLAGPATNAATVTVVGRFWGKRATAVYLGVIALCSLILGWLTNRLYDLTGTDITRWVARIGEAADSPWMVASAVVLLLLMARNYLPRKKKGGSCCDRPEPGG